MASLDDRLFVAEIRHEQRRQASKDLGRLTLILLIIGALCVGGGLILNVNVLLIIAGGLTGTFGFLIGIFWVASFEPKY